MIKRVIIVSCRRKNSRHVRSMIINRENEEIIGIRIRESVMSGKENMKEAGKREG